MNGVGACRTPGAKDSNHYRVFLLNSHSYPNISHYFLDLKENTYPLFNGYKKFTHLQLSPPHSKLP